MTKAEGKSSDEGERLHIMDDSERASKRVLSEPPLHSSSKERDAAIKSLAQDPGDELMGILSEDDDGDESHGDAEDDPMQTEDDGE